MTAPTVTGHQGPALCGWGPVISEVLSLELRIPIRR
jgi:hypothetical protein